jgi:hypothetical protein
VLEASVPDYRKREARAGCGVLAGFLAIVLCVSIHPTIVANGEAAQKKSAAKRPSKQPAAVPASLLRAVRASVSDVTPVKIVRSPRRGVIRVVLDQALVKEAEYRTALVGSCGAIQKAKAQNIASTLEILNADERQGYVYRPTSNCADVIAADDDRRRMVILPQTTIFRAPK